MLPLPGHPAARAVRALALVSLGALAFVFTKIDFSQMGAILRESRIGLLLLAILVFAASKLIAAFRLNLFFRSIGIRLSEGQNIRLYLLGMYYNLFLPGGITKSSEGGINKSTLVKASSKSGLVDSFQASRLVSARLRM